MAIRSESGNVAVVSDDGGDVRLPSLPDCKTIEPLDSVTSPKAVRPGRSRAGGKHRGLAWYIMHAKNC